MISPCWPESDLRTCADAGAEKEAKEKSASADSKKEKEAMGQSAAARGPAEMLGATLRHVAVRSCRELAFAAQLVD